MTLWFIRLIAALALVHGASPVFAQTTSQEGIQESPQSPTNGPSLLQFEAERINVRETAAALSLNIRPLGELTDALIFGVLIEPLEGANPATVSSLETQITLYPWDAGAEINLIINDDADLSGDQSYAIQLYPIFLGSNQGVLTSNAALVQVIDDEGFAPARLIDGEIVEGAGPFPLILRLDRPAAVPISATIELSPQSARAQQDYRPQRTTIRMEPGQTQAQISIDIIDDTIFEREERLLARIVQSKALEVLDFDAEIIIVDNDTPPNLVFSEMQSREGQGKGRVAVALDQAAGIETSVRFDFQSGTAISGQDFSGVSGTLIFPEGVTRQFINFDVFDDSRDEANEAFTLIFRDPDNMQVPEDALTITLIDDDAAPNLRITVPDLREGEGADASFTLDAPSDKPVSFVVSLAPGSAEIPQDILPIQQSFTLAPGETGPLTLPLNPLADDVYEQTETLNLQIQQIQNVRVSDPEIPLTIIDLNALPILTLARVQADEGGGEDFLTFELSEPSSRPSRFTLSLSDGDATRGQDYGGLNDSFSFATGQTSLTVPLQIIDDLQNEAAETIIVSLTQAEGLEFAQDAYEITLINDDAPPKLRVEGPDSLPEGSQSPLILSLILSEISGQDIDLSLSLTSPNGSQQAAGVNTADFAQIPNRLTIPAGARDIQLELQPINDDLFERVEAFRLLLSPNAPNGETLDGPIAYDVTLTDDDAPPLISVTAPPLVEGARSDGSSPMFLSLSKPAGIETAIELGVFEGSAREGLDYEITTTTVLIPPGQSSVQVPLTLIDDQIYEGEESFEIALLSSNAALINENLVVVTITDDDAFPQLSLANREVGEGDGERGLLTFALSTPSDQGVEFDYAFTDGTATLGQDYLTQAGTLVFAPGQIERTVDLQIVDDRAYEGNQTLRLSIDNLRGADLADGQDEWDLDLQDNDPLPHLTVTDARVLEAASDAPATVGFSLDRRSELPVSFDYRLSQEGQQSLDLSLTPGTLTFAPGEVDKTLTIAPVQDTIDEDTEIFHIILDRAQNVRLPETAARVSLIDDDPAPNLLINDAVAMETDGAAGSSNTLVFTLSLNTPSGREVTADVLTVLDPNTQNPAEIGVDLTPLGQTVVFPPGITEVQVPIQLISDGLNEEDEEFNLAILSVQNANLIDAFGIGRIVDTDSEPLIIADNLAVLESASSEAAAIQAPMPAMRLHLSNPSGKDIYVDYLLVPETARVGSDIEPVQGTLIFPVGVTEQFIPLRLLNDNLDEGVETLALRLSNPSGAQIDDAVARLTITDDDLGPELQVTAPQLREGQEADQTVARVSLAQASAQPLSLRWELIAKSATAGQDFRAQRGTLTFAPGQTVGLIPIRVLEDAVDEMDEELELLLTSDQIRITTPTTPIVISDNDPAPILSLQSTVLQEQVSLNQITLRLSEAAQRDLPGQLTLGDTTASLGDDFILPHMEFVIPAGARELSIPIELTNDLRDEPDERFTLTADLSVSDAPPAARATYTIADDDPEPILSLVDLEVVEGEEAAIVVEVSQPSGKAITLSYITIAGSAQAGEEFEALRRTVSLPPNSAQARLPLALIDDEFDEIAETFAVQIQNAAKASLGRARGQVTILDNDPPVQVSIGMAEAGEDGSLRVPLTLAGPSGHPVELELETVSGIAISNEDYVPRIGRVLFEPGQTQASFTIDLIDDGFEEGTETFGLKINSARNAVFDETAVLVSILDNDQPARLTVEALRMVEAEGSAGGLLRFTLAAESNDVVVIEYDVIDGTAQNDLDYALGPGALIFLPGEMEKLVTVPLQADGIDEFDETFTLSILAANVEIDQNQIAITIEDSDPSPDLSLIPAEADEGDGELGINLVLSSVTEKQVSGQVILTPGVAFSPALEGQTIPFEIPAGQRSLRISVPIRDDEFDEFDEGFTLALKDVDHANTPKDLFDGLIRNDDPATEITLAEATFVEGQSGQSTIEVLLDRPSGKPIVFDFAIQDKTADQDTDWTSDSGQARLIPGQQTTSIPITILDDAVYEGDEQFEIALSNFIHAQSPAPTGRYTIEEDEAPPSLILTKAEVSEGAPLAMPIRLDTPSALPLTLQVSVRDGTASVGRDLEPVEGLIEFEPGQTEALVYLLPIDDPFDEVAEDVLLSFTADIIQTPDDPLAVTLLDNDAPPVLSVRDITRSEGASGQVDLTLSIASNKPISFEVSAQDGTAKRGEDYEFDRQRYTLSPGETQVSLPLTFINDVLDEDVESYALVFSDLENLSLSQDRLTIRLIDTDPEPLIHVSDLIFDEDAAQDAAFLELTLSEPSGRPVTLRLASADSSAVSFDDFDPVAQDVVFPAGQTVQRVPIALIDDALFEAAESFLLTLGSVDHARAPTRDILVTILDNDPRPQLLYADQTLAEGPNDPAFAIPVRLSNPAGQDINIQFVINEQASNAQGDLRFDSLSLSFPAGQTQGLIRGNLIDDPRDEMDQTLALIPLASDIFLAPEQPLILTVRDDDPAPDLWLETTLLNEDGTGLDRLIARLSRPSEKAVSARLTFADGTALAGQDFVAASRTLTFAPGEVEQSIDLDVIDDQMFELEETLTLVLSENRAVTLPQPQVSVAIFDNDPQPLLAMKPITVGEGETKDAELTLDAPSSQQVSVTYALTSDTAREGLDFARQTNTIVFEPGETAKTIQLSALNDDIDEAEETAQFTLINVSNARVQAISTPITLIDRNERPTLALTSQATLENALDGGVIFTLSLSHPSASPLKLTYHTQDDSAVGGQDFVHASGQLVFAPGQQTKTLRIDLINDDLFEGDEAFALTLAFADDPVGTIDAAGQIRDDEAAPQILVDAEPTSEGQGSLAVFVRLDRPTTLPLTFAFATVDGTALSGRDYVAVQGILEFGPDRDRDMVFIDLLDDSLREDAEALTLNLTLLDDGAAPSGAAQTHDLQARLQIMDNDPLPIIENAPLIISEDEGGDGTTKSFMYNLRLDTPSDQTITAQYTTVFDGEADRSDVTPARGLVTFAPGQTEANIELEIRQDGLAEGDETLSLVFTNVENARMATPRAQLTLRESQQPRLTIAAAETIEGQPLIFDLRLSPVSPRPLYILYGVLDAQGQPIGRPQPFVFAAGQSTASLSIETEDNLIDEADRPLTFTATVTDDSPLRLTTAQIEAPGLIRDDDPDPILTISASPLVEGETGELRLNLDGQTAKDTVLTLRLGDGGTAQVGQDIAPMEIQLPIQELVKGMQIPLTPIDDSLNENPETFELVIAGDGVSVLIDQPSLVIADNDALPVLSSGVISVREGAETPPMISLSAPSGRDIRLQYTTEDQSAAQGPDFTVNMREVLIPVGQTQAPLPLGLVDDAIYELTENFTILITAAEYVEVPETRIPVQILDDDAAPKLSVSIDTADEGDQGALTLTLNAASSVDTLVALQVVGGTAQRGRDYDLSSQQILLPAGARTGRVFIPYLADGIFEGPETFTLNFEMVQGAVLETEQLTARIVDADMPPAVLVADRTVWETTQDEILIDVQIFGAFENTLTLTYTLESDTATAGQDFVAASGTLTLTPGQSEGLISVRLLDDQIPEGTERFILALTSEPAIDLPSKPIVIEIVDNEFYTQP